MSPKKWIEATDAIGLVSRAGRYGGTYADEADMLNVVLFGKTAILMARKFESHIKGEATR